MAFSHVFTSGLLLTQIFLLVCWLVRIRDETIVAIAFRWAESLAFGSSLVRGDAVLDEGMGRKLSLYTIKGF